MRRREFVGLLGGGVAGLSGLLGSPVVHGQQPQKQRRLAFVHSGIPADSLTESGGPFWVRRFHESLRGLGDVEGQNLVIERYSAEGHSDRFAAIAAEVVGRKPDVILTNFNDLVKTFMAATTAIPIVAVVGDPIAGGLVTNLARPGGNLTGVSINAGIEIYGKRLQILKEATPSASRIGNLVSGGWDDGRSAPLGEVAQRLKLTVMLLMMPVVNDPQLQRIFADMAQQGIDAAIIDEGGSFLAQRAAVVGLAEKYRLPMIYPYRDYVEEGGLIAFAPDLGELAERMASDVHQIFNGAKPGDIPFYQPSKFQLIINLKTAKAMSLDIPATLLARADEVIE
jgi:putative tryptophan/tyrosine transport system substrate-binding protein